MPNSPEGISSILAQLSEVSREMGKYATALEANTRAISELREEMEHVKEKLAERALEEAKQEGRDEQRRATEEQKKGSSAMILNLTVKDIVILAAAGMAIIKGFWKEIIGMFGPGASQ